MNHKQMNVGGQTSLKKYIARFGFDMKKTQIVNLSSGKNCKPGLAVVSHDGNLAIFELWYRWRGTTSDTILFKVIRAYHYQTNIPIKTICEAVDYDYETNGYRFETGL